MLVPPLMAVFRATNNDVPTVLRSSAISILATITDVSIVALAPWLDLLIAGAADVLRLELVPLSAARVAPTEGPRPAVHEDSEDDRKEKIDQHTIEDNVPATTLSTKAPTLRRSALHFISLVLRTLIQEAYNSHEEEASGTNPAIAPSITVSSARIRNTTTSKLSQINVDRELLGRIGTVIRYARDVDVDMIVRDQAAECSELLDQYLKLWLGAV